MVMNNDFSRVLLDDCLKVDELGIDINKLNFQFSSKPLLIGGKAMEYYKIRESGEDIDFLIISFEKLMFLKVLAMRKPKYLRALELMRDRIGEINTMLHDFL
jgi:hypothetical protein